MAKQLDFGPVCSNYIVPEVFWFVPMLQTSKIAKCMLFTDVVTFADSHYYVHFISSTCFYLLNLYVCCKGALSFSQACIATSLCLYVNQC